MPSLRLIAWVFLFPVLLVLSGCNVFFPRAPAPPPSDALVLLPRPRSIFEAPGAFRPAGHPLDIQFSMLEQTCDDIQDWQSLVLEAVDPITGGQEPTASSALPYTIHLIINSPEDGHYEGGSPEAYRLLIGSKSIAVSASSEKGLFYGLQTLRQIARQCRPETGVPCVKIEDSPDFAHRGVMLDVSRDKVPKLETLKHLVDLFAELKYNQLQLYIEHSFAYPGHEIVWREASPLTANDIQELDAYCRARYIELIPNQNSFGHMERWLRHPEYNSLAEVSDEPVSLNPLDPGAIELLDSLYLALLPNFTSKYFNVGLDETRQLGEKASRQAVEEHGKGNVYMDFLLQIHALVQQYDRKMMIWGDMLFHHPEVLERLPKDVTVLVWGYRNRARFDEKVPPIAEAGLPFYVCPGTVAWNCTLGRVDVMQANNNAAAEWGLRCGAEGYLVADWGDHGHWQTLPISYPGFAYAAAMAWCGATNRDRAYAAALDTHLFPGLAPGVGEVLMDLGRAYQLPGETTEFMPPTTRFLYNPDWALDDPWMDTISTQGLHQAINLVENERRKLQTLAGGTTEAQRLRSEIDNSAQLFQFACRLGLARIETHAARPEAIPAARREALARELAAWLPAYRALWLDRNRPGGLKDSTSDLETLLQRLRVQAPEQPL